MSKMKLTFCQLAHLPGLHLLRQLKGARAHSLAQRLGVTALLESAALSLSPERVALCLSTCWEGPQACAVPQTTAEE